MNLAQDQSDGGLSSSEHQDDRRGLEFATLVDQAVSEINLWREEQAYDLHDIDDAIVDQLILSSEERLQREAYWELVLARTHGISRQPKEHSSEHGEGRKKARREREAEERRVKTIDFGALGDDDNFDGDDSLFSETDHDVGALATSHLGNAFSDLVDDKDMSSLLGTHFALPQFNDVHLDDGGNLFARADADIGSATKKQKPNPPRGKKGVEGIGGGGSGKLNPNALVSLTSFDDEFSLAPKKKHPLPHAGTDIEDFDPFSDR